MSPELQSPLERLHRRIIARDNTLTEADVDKAVADEIAVLKEKFKDDPATLSNREGRLREFHERLKQERADLLKAYGEGKLDYFNDSRVLWEATPSLETLKARPRQFDEALSKAREITDPDSDADNAIDDYEGWGPGWISEGSNKDNETRWTLSGYLTAMGLDSPQARDNSYGRAYDVYDSFTGSVLKYDELREDMLMGKYLDELRKYPDLEDEARGYLVGCLALSESAYPHTNDTYRRYLYETVDKMGADGKFKISADKNKWDRGHDQMVLLKSVYTPREWNETHHEARVAFERLKANAAVLAASLGFTLPDDVVQFLNKDLLNVTNADMKKITDYSDMITAMARGKLVEKRDKLATNVADTEKKLGELIGKNNTAKKYTQQSIDELKKKFEDAKAGIAVAAAGNLLMIEAVMSENAAIESASANLGSVSSTIDSMMAGFAIAGGGGSGTGGGGGGGGPGEGPPTGVDVYENKWNSAELVESRWKLSNVKVAPSLADTPYRNDNGKIIGKIAGNTELRIVDVEAKARKIDGVTFVKVEYNGQQVWVDEAALVLGEGASESREDRERDEFLKQKNLKEIKGSNEYVYHLKLPQSKEKNGGLEFMFGNTEVDNIFGKKLNAYIAPLLKKLKNGPKGGGLGDIFDRQYSSESEMANVITDKLSKFLAKTEVKKIVAAFIIMGKAYDESSMTFQGEKPPKASDLRDSYNKNFISAWERAAGKIDKLDKPGKETPSETDGTPEGSKYATTIDPEITKMLGGVEAAHKYADVSHEILKYIKNPEKYPQGITVQLPLNNTLVPAVIYYANGASGPAFINFPSNPARKYRYSSMEGLVKRVHQGHVLSRRQFDILGDKSSYKQWESYIGELDTLDQEATYGESAKKWTHKLEFDWPGTDPDIWVRPDIHGRIVYVIDRDNAAPDGSDVRKGYCENFNAFLVVMKRYRDWTERYDDIPDGSKAVEARKEQQYDKIIHPRTFRQVANRIGRVVQLSTRANGVDMILDWGGGNNLNSPKNGKLKVWITSNGDLAYQVSREDVNRAGSAGTVKNFGQIISAVEKIKKTL